MSVKNDGGFFGSWNDSLRKYHDQSLLFSRQERSIVNVLQLRRSRRLQGLNIEHAENDAEAVIQHPPAAAQLISNLKAFTKTRDLFLKSFRLLQRKILTNVDGTRAYTAFPLSLNKFDFPENAFTNNITMGFKIRI